VKQQQRRRTTRHSVAWQGRCTAADDPDRRWTDCHLIDVSIAGAALELSDQPTRVGARLVLEIREVPGEVVGMVFNADVKNVGRTDRGYRIGVEFVDVGALERAVLRSLFGDS
jgi:hypothetical protein